MTTPARNYRKNPHTASFLMAFHTAGGTAVLDREDTYEVPEHTGGSDGMVEINRGRVAEDTTPYTGPKPRDARSEGQVRYMNNLIAWITEKDAEAGALARTWTDNVTDNGLWTYDKTAKYSISGWIDRLKAKNAALNEAAKNAPVTSASPVVSSKMVQHDELPMRDTKTGKPMPQYFAVEEDGELHFFKIKAGTKPGWWWISIQASDEFHPIKNVTRKNAILRAIIETGPEACMRRYGQEIGSCGRCHRTLTDPTSRAHGIGPECEGMM